MSFEPNEMMMDLFRTEVDSHTETLTSSLLELENDPTAANVLEQMMRAAHSIKGAAKIVRVAPAAEVAHVMEDCFVAAQKGDLALGSNDVDVLLQGVDLLTSIADATKADDTNWGAIEETVRAISRRLQAVRAGNANEIKSEIPSAAIPLVESVSKIATPAVPGETARRYRMICTEFLDAPQSEAARRSLIDAIQSGAQQVDIDLSRTKDLDASGLAFLDAVIKHLADRQLEYQCLLSPEMEFVFRLIDIPPSNSLR